MPGHGSYPRHVASLCQRRLRDPATGGYCACPLPYQPAPQRCGRQCQARGKQGTRQGGRHPPERQPLLLVEQRGEPRQGTRRTVCCTEEVRPESGSCMGDQGDVPRLLGLPVCRLGRAPFRALVRLGHTQPVGADQEESKDDQEPFAQYPDLFQTQDQ